MATAQQMGDTENSRIGTVLNHLAVACTYKGNFAEAESHILRSIGIRTKALGPNHCNVAHSLTTLAFVYYFSQTKLAAAEDLLKRALNIYQIQGEVWLHSLHSINIKLVNTY